MRDGIYALMRSRDLAERFAPRPKKRIRLTLNHGSTLILDAKFAARDTAELLKLNIVLCRNCGHTGKRRRRDRHDRARSAFAEEREFGGFVASLRCSQINLRGKSVAREARFRHRRGHTAVAHIVRRKNRAVG